MSYYVTIEGKKYNRNLIELAKGMTIGWGDGRISYADAQEIHVAAQDGGRVTGVEHDTIVYLLDTMKWTSKAEDWLREELGLGAQDEEACILFYIEKELADYWTARNEARKQEKEFKEAFLESYETNRLEGDRPVLVNTAVQYYLNRVENRDQGTVRLYQVPGSKVKDFCPLIDVGPVLFVVRTTTDGDDGWIELLDAGGHPKGYGRTLLELASWGAKENIREQTLTMEISQELQDRRSDSLWGK